MKIRVKLFAVAREAAGAEFIDVDVPSGDVPSGEAAEVSVAALRQAFLQRLPSLQFAAKQLLFAVDGDYATDTTRIDARSEVACIPPVSGG